MSPTAHPDLPLVNSYFFCKKSRDLRFVGKVSVGRGTVGMWVLVPAGPL